jgi:hypothetical protein
VEQWQIPEFQMPAEQHVMPNHLELKGAGG